MALWMVCCLSVSSAKAQFNTVSNNACRYKIRKVEEVGYDARSGNYIILRHADFTVSYCHLSKVHFTPGTPVFAGTIIGSSGSTGRAIGEHLHLTVKYKKAYLNPKILLEKIGEYALSMK